jgi:hypothetical protein
VLAVLITVSLSEQWANIKFFCKLGKSEVETLVGLSAVYPVYEWHNQFNNGQE